MVLYSWYFSRFILIVYLCNASHRDGHTMTGVDFVTLHVESQGIECDSNKKMRD